jgi:hypothetical protein
LHANREGLKRVSSFKKRDLDNPLSDVAVGCGGMEAILAEHIWVELGNGDHRRKVIVQARRKVS